MREWVGLIYPDKDRGRQHALVTTAMNFVSIKCKAFLESQRIFVSEEGLKSTELIFSNLFISNDDVKITWTTYP
jgi:hypothetical protein